MQQIASTAQLRASLLRWSLFTVPLCLGLGLFSSAVAGSVAQNPWFAMLEKPVMYPPPVVFPVVWAVLYILMGLALALLAAARGARGRVLAWRVRRIAAALLLPYLVWVCFAALLDLQIVQRNPGLDGVAGPGAAVRMQL